MTEEPKQAPPADYAETLRKHFAELRVDGKPRFRMSVRNQQKLERIRKLVGELRGQR